MGVAAAAIGNKVMFAGGYKDGDGSPENIISTVDIYDLSANSWSTTNLSEARGFISAITANNKVYFAGGETGYMKFSKTIDIYDGSTNSWSTSTLQYLSGAGIKGTFLNNNIYWAGSGCNVEIKIINSGSNTNALLSRPDVQYSVVKDGKVIFLRYSNSSNTIEVYNPVTNTWSIALLPQSLPGGAAIISVNNTIYIAGGSIGCIPFDQGGGCSPVYTNQVYKLEF
jgi:kelch-like protein 20